LNLDEKPAVALRFGPPTILIRSNRIDELERVIGTRPLVADIEISDAQVIVDEARLLNADVIVLDSPGGDDFAATIAREAARHDLAVVVAPNTQLGTDSHGRQTITFRGYERMDERGDLTPLQDGELRAEIERRRERHEETINRDHGRGYSY
jgi:hypothetical protein